MKEIDYLVEDPVIEGQRWTLVTIVAPESATHIKAKCDIWGIKIRGFAKNYEEAQRKAKYLRNNVDSDFDIYIVEVGKFFPLVVDPLKVEDINYQNEQLNTLIKGYKENREKASTFFNERKQRMKEQAIKEAMDKSNAEKPEHAISVLNRIETTKQKIERMQRELSDVKESLSRDESKFNNEYTPEEKEYADKYIKDYLAGDKTITEEVDNFEPKVSLVESKTTIKEYLEIEDLINKIKESRTTQQKLEYKKQLEKYDKSIINEYINTYFDNTSDVHALFN